MLGTLAPVFEAPFRRTRDIDPIVRAVTGPHGLGGMSPPPTQQALELLGIALSEVLQNVVELCGPHRPGSASVELWVEPGLVVIAVHHAGPPLPDWLLVNWDRGQPPAVIAPPGGRGWGWLMVREAVESVMQTRSRRGMLLFLEKRL